MTVRLVLVHSPLVGPATWQAVSNCLEERGQAFSMPDLTPSVRGDPQYVARQIKTIVESAAGEGAILVGHSGAGPLLAAAGKSIEQVQGYLFVDAGLPCPGHCWMDVVPKELAAHLRDNAEDGWLPPWPEWWGPGGLVELLPDAEMRAGFIVSCPRLPLAMFEEVHPAVPGWPNAQAAFLRLSDAYEDSAAQAEALGWPVVERDSNHLALVSDPESVVGPLLELADWLQQ